MPLQQSVLVTPPAQELFTSAQACAWARIDPQIQTYDAALITALITAARTAAEQFTGRAFITQTWDAFWTGEKPFSSAVLRMPKRDVQYVTVVDYTVANQSPTLLTQVTDYYQNGPDVVLTAGYPFGFFSTSGSMNPFASSWTDPYASGPTDRDWFTRWHVQYVAGYGDSPSDVPQDIVTACLMLFTNYYESRAGEPPYARYKSEDIGGGLPVQIAKILSPYQVLSL